MKRSTRRRQPQSLQLTASALQSTAFSISIRKPGGLIRGPGATAIRKQEEVFLFFLRLIPGIFCSVSMSKALAFQIKSGQFQMESDRRTALASI